MCHYLCQGQVERGVKQALAAEFREMEEGRMGTQLPGEQEAAPHPNLEVIKETEWWPLALGCC